MLIHVLTIYKTSQSSCHPFNPCQLLLLLPLQQRIPIPMIRKRNSRTLPTSKSDPDIVRVKQRLLRKQIPKTIIHRVEWPIYGLIGQVDTLSSSEGSSKSALSMGRPNQNVCMYVKASTPGSSADGSSISSGDSAFGIWFSTSTRTARKGLAFGRVGLGSISES